MPHSITVPINENGIIFDSQMNNVVAEAMAFHPFGFTDVYLYSHGWATDADRALDLYNQFSIDLAKLLLITSPTGVYESPPGEALGVGIHWPSQITENPGSILNTLELFTFYTMEHRAESVGKNALYAMLRLMLTTRVGSGPLRFFLIGHSFGCKVICAALQDVHADIDNGTIPIDPKTTFNAVLIEPATDNNNLEPGDIYGDLCKLPLRMLITTSQLDTALNTWFVAAGRLANVFKSPRQALGAAGPTAPTVAAFGGSPPTLQVDHGFNARSLAGLRQRLIVADLTPIHQFRVASGLYPKDPLAGSHSDFCFDEVYQLIAGFLFGLSPKASPPPGTL